MILHTRSSWNKHWRSNQTTSTSTPFLERTSQASHRFHSYSLYPMVGRFHHNPSQLETFKLRIAAIKYYMYSTVLTLDHRSLLHRGLRQTLLFTVWSLAQFILPCAQHFIQVSGLRLAPSILPLSIFQRTVQWSLSPPHSKVRMRK